MNEESEAQVTRADQDYVLDGGAVGASRELAIDKDACRKVHLALERLIVEFMREGCRRHCCGVCGEQILLEVGDYIRKAWPSERKNRDVSMVTVQYPVSYFTPYDVLGTAPETATTLQKEVEMTSWCHAWCGHKRRQSCGHEA